MDRNEFIGKLNMAYCGDKNALEEVLRIYDEKEDRINKAIEYIKNHTIEWVDNKFEVHNVMVKFNEYSNPQLLLEILGDE